MSAIFAPAPADQTRVRCVDLLAQLRFLLANPSTDANQKFRASYDELASFPQEHACAELLECLFVISNYFYLAAQPSLGLPSATRGVEIARRLENPRLLRRALSIFGVMCMETGNLPGSTEALSEALEIARVLRDPALEAPIGTTLDWPSKEPLSTETLFSALSGLRQERALRQRLSQKWRSRPTQTWQVVLSTCTMFVRVSSLFARLLHSTPIRHRPTIASCE